MVCSVTVKRSVQLWRAQRQQRSRNGYGVLSDSEGVGTALACPVIAKESVQLWCARQWRCGSPQSEGLKILVTGVWCGVPVLNVGDFAQASLMARCSKSVVGAGRQGTLTVLRLVAWHSAGC